MREHQITVPTDPRIAEGYSSARALGRTILAVLSVTALGLLTGLVLWALPAAAASDSPTPYTVDRTGITLPAGQTFPDGGHVNIEWGGIRSGLHFEGKCLTRTDAECAGARHDAAQFIGASFIPWAAFGVPADACITWVQISTFTEHFGEGGQPPVCLTEEEPWTPEPQPTEPTEPTEDPSPTETASPSPSTTPTSSPSATTGPSPAPSAAPSETPSTPVPSSAPSEAPVPSRPSTPATPVTPPEDYDQGDLDVTYRSEVSAVDEPTTPPAELAATGSDAMVIGITAAIALVLGAYLVLFEARRRRGERCPQCGGPLDPITRTHPVHGDWDGVTCRDCFWTEVR